MSPLLCIGECAAAVREYGGGVVWTSADGLERRVVLEVGAERVRWRSNGVVRTETLAVFALWVSARGADPR